MLSQADKVAKAKLIRQGVAGAVKGIRAVPAIIQRVGLGDEDALEFADIYPEWHVNRKYKIDDVFRYEGELYRVNQDHTSQEQYVPGAEGTESLYTHITVDEESGFEVWQEPTGAHDAYEKDFIVKDPEDGNLYKSLVDGNVWGPPSTQPQFWELYQTLSE